ncbi:MAG: hypothetical protein K0Q43_158 [Ramlibacter sp.]|jgi:hypothetical protein|nr:hypothetical protein [Ramlibacter sp.]
MSALGDRVLAFRKAAAQHGVQATVHAADAKTASRVGLAVAACAAALAVTVAPKAPAQDAEIRAQRPSVGSVGTWDDQEGSYEQGLHKQLRWVNVYWNGQPLQTLDVRSRLLLVQAAAARVRLDQVGLGAAGAPLPEETRAHVHNTFQGAQLAQREQARPGTRVALGYLDGVVSEQAQRGAGESEQQIASLGSTAGSSAMSIAGIKSVLKVKMLERSPEALALTPHLSTSFCTPVMTGMRNPVFTRRCIQASERYSATALPPVLAQMAVLGEFHRTPVFLADPGSEVNGQSEKEILQEFNAVSMRFTSREGGKGIDAIILYKPLVQHLMKLPATARDAALVFVMGHERGHIAHGDVYPEGDVTPDVVAQLIEHEIAADFAGFQAMAGEGFDVESQRLAVRAVLGITDGVPGPVRQVTAARLAELDRWLANLQEDQEQVARAAQHPESHMAQR